MGYGSVEFVYVHKAGEMSTMTLTKEQRFYSFIRGYIASNGESPTMKEIGGYFHIKGPASIAVVLDKLEAQGLIKRTRNISRGIEVL